jgi:HSP20 family protein
MFNRKETGLTRRTDLWDPFALLGRMTTDFDRIFEEAGWPVFRRAFTEPAGWSPKLDVYEKDNQLFATLDLPGVKKEDVKAEITDGRLVISGERRYETEKKEENFYRSEREYGTFYRAIPLPEGAKFEDIKATFENGVLTVTVPLAARAAITGHKVPIEEPAKGAEKAAKAA